MAETRGRNPDPERRPRRDARFGVLEAIHRKGAAARRVASVLVASRGRLAVLVPLAVTAGIVEASLLAVIAAAAAALSQDAKTIELAVGPWLIDPSRSVAFSVAVALAILRAALQVILAYLPAKMSSLALADTRRQLFTTYTASSWATKSNERDGAFVTLVTHSATGLAQSVVHLGAGLTALLMFVTILAAAFLQNAAAAGIMTILAIGLFLLLRPLSRIMRRHARQLADGTTEFTARTEEVVAVAEEVEVFGHTPSYMARFLDQVENVRRSYVHTRFLSSAIPTLQQSVALLMIVLALAAIAGAGLDDLGEIAAVVLMLIRALTYAQQLQFAVTAIEERTPLIDQILAALDRFRAGAQQEGSIEIDEIRTIALEDASFGYQPATQVLRGVTFEVTRGQGLGIVGPSGAGKSSIVQLLLRLRSPTDGAVLANGMNVESISRSSWRRKVAYLPQTSQLISASVRENIRFFRDWITDEEVMRAARRAHIHEEICTWRNGYDTHIGQREGAISGGQRQRICLARALAGNPEVLILDEPTSALDVRSEAMVQQTLLDIKPDLALVLIAHRLSTLSVVDHVVVIAEGEVSSSGPTDEILDRDPFFKRVLAGEQASFHHPDRKDGIRSGPLDPC